LSIFAKRTKRIVAGTLAGALAMSVTPILGLVGTASAADALPPVADPIGAGNVCENSPTTEPFTDVTDADPGHDEIACLFGAELTTGKTATTYEPNSPITRRQMALFIKRVIDKANELETGDLTALPAYDGTPDFADVAAESAAVQEAVGQLNQAGVVQGTTATTYSPAQFVSRRQMAAFINRTQDFLTGDPFTTTGDFFDDDNGDTGEDNLNAVASVGIFQGDGAGNVNPGGNLSRRQMAFVLLRHLQVVFDDGDIGPLFEGNNQTFTVPQERLVQEVNSTRTCTVTGIPAGSVVDVALFANSDITTTNGVISLKDTAANNGEADLTPVAGAVIANINGANVAPAAQVNDVVAAIGAISVTFTSANPAGGDVTLVVWADPRTTDTPAGDNELDLNAQDQPTEAFGVGCNTLFVPEEAANGVQAAGDVTLVEGTTLAVLDPSGTVFFNAGDTYRILAGAFYVSATPATFFANLSVDDFLFTCSNNLGFPDPYTQGGANNYCLEDVAPAGPTTLTAADGTPADTAIALDWTASTTTSVDSYKVYSNDETCAATTVAELGVIGTTNAATTAFSATGLTPDTDYCFVVTSLDGADESTLAVGTAGADVDNTIEWGTASPIEQPFIISSVLTTDAVTEGRPDTGDVWTITFNEDMFDGSDTGSTYAITDADGDTILVSCTAAAADTLTDATCVIDNGLVDNGIDDDTLTITLLEVATDRNLGGDGIIEYPLTITAITGLEDDDDGAPINMTASTDLVIG